MDNTYAVRTRLKVPSRPNNRLPLVRPDPVTTLMVEKPVDVVHVALPTIPIMKYVTSKQSVDMPLPKPSMNMAPPVFSKPTSNSIIRPAVPRKLLTELMIGEIEPEPATYSSSTKFTHKIVRHKRPLLKQVSLAVLVAAVLGTTGYVSYDSWQTNNKVRLAIDNDSDTTAVLGTVSKSKSTNGEVNPIGDYMVANDLPRAVYIDKIGVAAKVLQTGINTDGTLQSPDTASDVGWYINSAKPGQSGAMLLDGHTDTQAVPPGVFSYLGDLVLGDTIVIERGDGKRSDYTVVNIQTLPLEEVDMSALLVPYNNASQGVNLITYIGNWTSDGGTLDHRLIVYAVASN